MVNIVHPENTPQQGEFSRFGWSTEADINYFL